MNSVLEPTCDTPAMRLLAFCSERGGRPFRKLERDGSRGSFGWPPVRQLKAMQHTTTT